MKKAIITGGTGFLGRYLLNYLLQEGWNVILLVREASVATASMIYPDSMQAQVRIVSVDLFNLKELDIVELKQHIGEGDVFYHFAWSGLGRTQVGEEEIQDKNIAMSVLCLKLAEACKCNLFVNAGSRAEYGKCADVMGEDLECRPINAYGIAKLKFCDVEREASSRIKIIHLRIFSVYGTDDHPWSLISSTIEKMQRNETVNLSLCEHQWNFLYIKDAVSAIGAITEYGETMSERFLVCNIASDTTDVLKSYIDQIKVLTRSESALQYGAFRSNEESNNSVIPGINVLKTKTEWTEKYTFSKAIEEMLS